MPCKHLQCTHVKSQYLQPKVCYSKKLNIRGFEINMFQTSKLNLTLFAVSMFQPQKKNLHVVTLIIKSSGHKVFLHLVIFEICTFDNQCF